MGKFDNVKKMDKDVAAAVKKSNEVARVPYYAVISNADIIDNPLNNENITDLADIENSIEKIGFNLKINERLHHAYVFRDTGYGERI